jgi:SAM-dependent methyltransferase
MSGSRRSGEMKPYLNNVRCCESFLERYGDTWQGVGWTKSERDVDTRYRVMLDVIRDDTAPVTLLDFGCGASHLYEYILRHGLDRITYEGLDLSRRFLQVSREKFPSVTYHDIDILDDAAALPDFDYVVANGVFTVRHMFSREEMVEYFESALERLYGSTRIGLAFNVMSKYVDWERDDLFHVSFDELASFLTRRLSRHFAIRHDYGLYEYTAYVYRKPS